MIPPTGSFASGRICTLAEAIREFLEQERLVGKSPATLRCHSNALRQFEKAFAGRDVRDLTAQDLEAYASDVRKRVVDSRAP